MEIRDVRDSKFYPLPSEKGHIEQLVPSFSVIC